MRRLQIATAILVALAVSATAAAQVSRGLAAPTITKLSAVAAPRSGRVVVTGSGFGAVRGDGVVLVSGLPAWVARWSDSSITAYVPEAAPTGPDQVQVVTQAGPSNQVPLQVDLRAARGRLLWRFMLDSMYELSRPAIGPDGTIYANDIDGRVYALTPDGGLKWLLNGVGSDGISVGPDGTVYVGSTRAITAIDPAGTIKWTFVENPGAFILLGPTVGPDGNIYAVATSGMGVISLTPTGQLRWSIPEAYGRLIVISQELAFGPGPDGKGTQMYFHANHHFEGVRSDGTVAFSIPGDGSRPTTGPDGTVYTHNWQTGVGYVLGAYTPAGDFKWGFAVSPNNTNTNPDVGPNGVVYVGWNLSNIYALTPTGTTRWHYVDPGIVQDPIASPLGTIVFLPGQTGYGERGFVAAVSASTGALRWKVSLPLDQGQPIVPFAYSRTRFARDGRTAYVPTITAGIYDHSFLYAVRTAA